MPLHLVNRVRECRQDGGLTQEELARRAGLERSTIVALEAGRRIPTMENAFRIARALGLSVEEVFDFVDQTPSKLAEITKAAASAGKGAMTALLICAGFWGLAAANEYRLEQQALSAGNFSMAIFHRDVLVGLVNPVERDAEEQAITAGYRLSLPGTRGDLEERCREWLRRYSQLLGTTDATLPEGRMLRGDAADCDDRLSLPSLAVGLREEIIHNPSPLLRADASIEYTSYEMAATRAYELGDREAAQFLMREAYRFHPSEFFRAKRVLSRYHSYRALFALASIK